MVVLSETLEVNNNKFLARKTMSGLFPSSAKTLSSSASFPISHTSHSFSESMMLENIENSEKIITKWDISSSSISKVISLFQNNRKEAKEFLKCVKDLRWAMHFLVSEHSDSEKLVLAQSLMEIAMKRLECEFYQILSANHDQLDPESVSGHSSDGSSKFEEEDNEGGGSEDEYFKIAGESITEVERVAVLAMSDLKSIADCMISSGYGRECIKIYKLIRKSIVDEWLYLLSIERYKSSQIQKMNWEALEHMIKKWINAVKIAVKTLFNGEKVLCDHIFSRSQTIRESCFSDITKDGAINLFRFPELIAKSKRSPERIFPLMDLYQALMNLWPEIEQLFNSEFTSTIKMQALSSLLRLSETVRAVLSDFESTIQKDSWKIPVPGGGIHPLTRKVMTYLSSLADYERVFSDIVAESPSPVHRPLPESYFDESTPTASVWIAWLILVLLCKLDSKAELYRDASLSYLFLSNNLQFIVDNVCKTRLRVLLGDDWLLKHVKKVKQYAASYETMAWTKVFFALPEKPSPDLTPEVAQEYFRRFNAAFEEAYRKQTSWIVPDRKLRDEMKISIAKKLVPAYRDFYNLTMSRRERNLEMSVRFSPDDLGNYLSDLFHGNAVSASSSISSSRGCIFR